MRLWLIQTKDPGFYDVAIAIVYASTGAQAREIAADKADDDPIAASSARDKILDPCQSTCKCLFKSGSHRNIYYELRWP